MKSSAMSSTVSFKPATELWDVIVAGGGPSGCAAATAAAREGARTLLIERTCSLGGMGTSALVPAWCPFSDKQKLLYGGLAAEIFALSKEGTDLVKPEALDWVPIDAEHLKRVYESLAIKAGVTLLFDTFLVGVQQDGSGTVERLIVGNKQGLRALEAKVFIDCTGDADVVAFAGGEFEKGDPTDGSLQPTTLCFTLAGINKEAYFKLPVLVHSIDGKPSIIEQIVSSGRHPEIPDRHLCHCWVGQGCAGFNAGHVYEIDNTNPYDVSRAIVQGRRIALAYRNALRDFLPDAFGQAHLVQTGSLLGTRETRRIIGDYVLTLDDYLDRRSFPDEICRNAYFIDIHLSREKAKKNVDWEAAVIHRFKQYAPGESHGLPYRCLVPRSLRNVLVAGRSVSTDRTVQGSVRVMPVCLAMGEAAGVAAVLALRHNDNDVHRVDTDRLRDILREHGGVLPDYVSVPIPA